MDLHILQLSGTKAGDLSQRRNAVAIVLGHIAAAVLTAVGTKTNIVGKVAERRRSALSLAHVRSISPIGYLKTKSERSTFWRNPSLKRP